MGDGIKWDQATPGVTWDEPAKRKGEAPSELLSGVRGALNGATFGFADEIGGALVSAFPSLGLTPEEFAKGEGSRLGSKPLPKPSYTQARDEARGLQAEAKETNPKSYLAGEVAGSVLATPGGGGGLRGAIKAASATGLASGLGNSDAEVMDGEIGGAVKDTLLGGTVGGVLGAAGHGVAKGAGSALKNFAARRAIKATGAIQGDIKGIPEERLLEMGRQMLGQGVIPLTGSKGKVLKRAVEALKGHGANIGDILEQADDEAARRLPTSFDRYEAGSFDWRPVLKKLGKQSDELGATGRASASKALSFADNIAEEARRGGGYSAANRVKSQIQDGINWRDDPKLATRAAKRIQGMLDDEIEQQLTSQLGEQLGSEYQTAKSLYGAMKLAKKGAQRGLERNVGNRVFGMGEQAAGLSGLRGDSLGETLKNTTTGALVAALYKTAVQRGSAPLAVGANALGNSKAVQSLARNPSVLAKLLAGPAAERMSSPEQEKRKALIEALRGEPTSQR